MISEISFPILGWGGGGGRGEWGKKRGVPVNILQGNVFQWDLKGRECERKGRECERKSKKVREREGMKEEREGM